MGKTLIETFIDYKAGGYEETPRKGTPRGRPLGFSMVKYRAGLLMIKNIKQEEIALQLRISHGLLRKWNTERAFKAMVERHCRDYASFFVDHIIEKTRESEKMREEYFAKPLKRIAHEPFPRSGHQEFRDSYLYSKELIRTIADAAIDYCKTAPFSYAFNVLTALFTIVRPLLGDRQIKEIINASGVNFDVVFRHFRQGLLEEIKNTLAKEDFSEQDRKNACYLLSGLANMLE